MERRPLVHPSRAGLLQPVPSSARAPVIPAVSAPVAEPSAPRPRFVSGGRIPDGIDYNGRVDPNLAPLKTMRKWGAPSIPAEQPSAAAPPKATEKDLSSSSAPPPTSVQGRSPPPTRVTLAVTVATPSAAAGPPSEPRLGAKRDWSTGDSYHPSSFHSDSRRDRYDPRQSRGMSRLDRERERELRYRDAAPRHNSNLPPEEPWETARIQERLAMEAVQKRVDAAKVSFHAIDI